MQFKRFALVVPLFAFAGASPVAEPKPEAADVATRAQLEKDSDDIWLWKKREAAQLQKDSDDVWLWKRADDSDDVWLWKRGQEATIKRAKLAKDSDDIWLWKKREAEASEKSKKSKLVKDADDIWLW